MAHSAAVTIRGEPPALYRSIAPGFDKLKPVRGAHFSLRWVLLHLIEETARHAGHADLLREAIDGSVG